MKRQRIISAILGTVLFSATAASAKLPRVGVSVTIYNNNFAVVRDVRHISFDKGMNKIEVTDIAKAIDPTSVKFECLSAPEAVRILEQDYTYDIADTASMLKRHIGKEVTVAVRGGGADTGKQITGVLLAVVQAGRAAGDYDLMLKTDAENIEILKESSIESISLKEVAEAFVTKPTLSWLARSKKKGRQLCEISYMTERLGWEAVYSAIVGEDDKQLEFAGWVTIDNRSGLSYEDAEIKLVAGEVRRARKPERRLMLAEAGAAADATSAAFEERSFMEYHLYTLGRKSTIKDNQKKQIELVAPASGVKAKKIYVYDRRKQEALSRAKRKEKVEVNIEFENNRANKLGVALPSGKVRVFKQDVSAGTMEFAGEDTIDHTPKEGKVSVYIGDSFDVSAKQTLVTTKRTRRMMQDKFRIELQNARSETVEVYVDEKFPSHVNWSIDEATEEYEKTDAYTVRFTIKIEANSAATLEYQATQNW